MPGTRFSIGPRGGGGGKHECVGDILVSFAAITLRRRESRVPRNFRCERPSSPIFHGGLLPKLPFSPSSSSIASSSSRTLVLPHPQPPTFLSGWARSYGSRGPYGFRFLSVELSSSSSFFLAAFTSRISFCSIFGTERITSSNAGTSAGPATRRRTTPSSSQHVVTAVYCRSDVFLTTNINNARGRLAQHHHQYQRHHHRQRWRRSNFNPLRILNGARPRAIRIYNRVITYEAYRVSFLDSFPTPSSRCKSAPINFSYSSHRPPIAAPLYFRCPADPR